MGTPLQHRKLSSRRTLFAVAIILVILALVLVLIWLNNRLRPQEAPSFVEGQVLVTGPARDTDAVMDNVRRALGLDKETLQLSERLELELLSTLPETCKTMPQTSRTDEMLVIDQYKIGGSVPVEDVIKEIQRQAHTLGVMVSPEPNYLTGRPPIKVEGDPWTVGASPWTVGASPWTVGASPSGFEILQAANEAFRKQWAFHAQGINLGDPQKDQPLGRGVRIGIFDTSPFPPLMTHVTLLMDPPLELALAHPIPGGNHTIDKEAPDVSDHGLFAAGLAHAVAPGSQIYLIRVLDDTGQGDLQTLNRALKTFIDETLTEKDRLNGAVINLSLGTYLPPDAEQKGLPTEIASLKTILAAAQCHGIVVIAASGNDSAKSSTPLPMQIPAQWDSALGVSASNDKQNLACFSNAGEVSAPGGDGGPQPPECRSMLHECSTTDCPYGLISLSLASDSGYAYWNGTSFSAPIVSGLSAVIIETEGGWPAPDVVFGRLKNSAAPQGVVNAQKCAP